MLFMAIIAAYCESHRKHTNALRREINFFNVSSGFKSGICNYHLIQERHDWDTVLLAELDILLSVSPGYM
jgi:quinol monooxygenase YgiN